MTATATTDGDATDHDDDFQQIEGPTFASIARQWLDRGLPAHTWLPYLAEWQRTTDAPVVPHTHSGDQCHPRCRRWGSQ
jgi:hypothetical protein